MTQCEPIMTVEELGADPRLVGVLTKASLLLTDSRGIFQAGAVGPPRYKTGILG